ncbi:GroES-like protein [Trametes meyenii]|nr:GroES-like protein [Trametes meyenii]
MAIPPVQKALVLHKESTPYVIEERPVSQPGPGDVLVKIFSCALNPVDWSMTEPPASRVLIPSFPFVPGLDAAGVVIGVGAGVTNLKEGDRILFESNWQPNAAAFQQYAIVPSDLTAIIPDTVTFDQAATIPLALTTVVLALYNQSPAPGNASLSLTPVWEPEGQTAYAGKPAFIVGGATSLGQLAGHSPIITTASPHNAELLTSLGATHVIDRSRSNESILAELPKLTGGKPIEFALVTAPPLPEVLRLGRDALAPGGALGTAMPGPQRIPEDVANPGEGKRVGYVFGSAHLPHTRETGIAMFQQISKWLEKGILKVRLGYEPLLLQTPTSVLMPILKTQPNLLEVIPKGLAGINDGLARLRANEVSGQKLVAHPQETP